MNLSQQAVCIPKANKGMLSIMKLRAIFAERYCDEKGWDVNSLSLDQVFEIRAQKGWQQV